MKISGFTLRPLSVALLCSLAACGGGGGGGSDNGGGGGTTPPPATSVTLTIKGDVQGLDGSNVAAFQGTTRIGQAAVGSDGQFNLTVTYEKSRADHPVHLTATSNTHIRHVLATQLDSPSTLLSKAGSDKVLDLSESGLVRINEFSTARYVQLQYANRNQVFATQATLTGKEQTVQAGYMGELALAAHMLTTGARSDTRLEVTDQPDTLTLMLNQNALTKWSRDLHALRDGDEPLFDKHYLIARDTILLSAARALPHSFAMGNFYGADFQFTLEAGGAAVMITDHENMAFGHNARWNPEGAQLRVAPEHSGGGSFKGYLPRANQAVRGLLAVDVPVQDLTFTKVSELASQPVVIKAIFPMTPEHSPYAETSLLLGDGQMEALNTSMFNAKSWFMGMPSPYRQASRRTPEGRWEHKFRSFESLTFNQDGTGVIPDLFATFNWTLSDSQTLRISDTSGALSISRSEVRRCKHGFGPFVCLQVTSSDSNSAVSASRTLAAEGSGLAFSPTETPLLVSLAPSFSQPLSAMWYTFKSDGTATYHHTKDKNGNGMLEVSEIWLSSGTWSEQNGKIVLEFYRFNVGAGDYCLPPASNCVKTRETQHLRLLARGNDPTTLLMHVYSVTALDIISSGARQMRPATQPPIAL